MLTCLAYPETAGGDAVAQAVTSLDIITYLGLGLVTDIHTRVDALVPAAEKFVFAETGLVMARSLWRLTLDAFPAGPIVVPAGPLIDVSAFSYYASGDRAFTSYRLDKAGGRIAPVNGWPTADATVAAVTIDLVLGHDDPSQVDDLAKQAVRRLSQHWLGDIGQDDSEKGTSIIDEVRAMLKPLSRKSEQRWTQNYV